MIALLALAAALAAPAQDPAAGTVLGTVRDEATGAPLVAAIVEVRGGAASATVLTDGSGRYTLRGLLAGRRLLRASHVGHEPLEVEVLVSAGGQLHVDFALRLQPVPLQQITVRGETNAPRRDTAAAPPPALGLAGMRVLEAAPGIVELGLGEQPHGAPGQTPVDPSSVLFVRGVPSDLKLVLLDGAPVYTPFHVGGLLDPFDTEVLQGATLYLGGAPARYDGGLSYILDLSTRAGRPDRVRGSGAVDMMSARLAAEGAAGSRLHYLFSGRGVHGYGMDPLLRGPVPYDYAEGLGRLDASIGAAGTLSLTGFRNREGVSFDSLGSGRVAGWANSALSLRYRGPLGRADSELTAALGSFEAGLPVSAERAGPVRGETQRLRLTGDFARDLAGLRLRYGASFDHLTLYHQVRAAPRGAASRTWNGEVAGTVAGSYLEAAWQPAPRLRLRGGLRGDLFFADPELRLAPRLSATWMLSERAALTAAAGRYHQYVRTSQRVIEPLSTGAPDTVYLPAELAVDGATHLNLALHQEFSEGVRLGLEGFFKVFTTRHDPAAEHTNASGIDIWVRRDAGAVRGWLGYSLSWVWALAPGQTAAERFAGRQLLNAGVSGPLGEWAELELRFAYGAGLPFSAIPLNALVPTAGDAPLPTRQAFSAGEVPLLPQPPSSPYLRLDIGLSRTFTTRWRDTPLELSPYLKVLNSLDRRDALFYWAEREHGSSPRAVAPLPVLPVIGMGWRF